MIVRSHPFHPANQLIVIEHFECYPETSRDLAKSFAKDLGVSLALDLQKKLRKVGPQRSLVISPGEPVIGDLFIRGRITRLSGGNRFHRMTFELFGYGASEAQAMGEVIEVRTSTSLMAFSISRRSSWTWKGNEGGIRENIEEIAEAIVEVILQGQK